MEASFLNNVYKTWMNSSGFLFYFNHLGDTSADCKTAKAFVTNGSYMPMARIWWSSSGQVKVDIKYGGSALKKNATTLRDKFKDALASYTPPPPEPTKYSVTFNPNGGTLMSGMTRTVTENTAIGELPVPTRSGWTFNGWFTAASGGTQISAATVITANATYYAHWTEIPITPPTPDPPSPEPDQPQPPPTPGQPLKTMFGLCRDCTIITKDNKILQYSAAAQKITLVGDYNPNEFLAVSTKIT